MISCTLRGGTKHRQVCLNGSDAVNKYGPTSGAPELEITTPVGTLDYLPRPGVGCDIWETVTFANGAFRYEVVSGSSRPFGEGDAVPSPTYGSIHITRDDGVIADLTCDADSVEWGYCGGFFDAKTALGLCWEGHPTKAWGPCPSE
ncbi:hypothetical protein [Sulfitobacter sp.]|uniref:hypothetical protein n=1 Tax=Sulfitobacter sp. TaxID=1903071 RepID=UPI00300228C6